MMDAALTTAALRALERHQHRRDGGIPVLSVLAGPEETAAALWCDWSSAAGRVPLRVRATGRDPAVEAAVAWADQPWVPARWIDHVVSGGSRRVERILGTLSGEPSQERSRLVHRLLSEAPSEAVEALGRHLLLDGDGPQDQRGTAELIRGLAGVEGSRAPGLLFLSFSAVAATARSLVDLVELCPRVPVGWVVPASAHAECVGRMPPSRAATLCREGWIDLESNPVDPRSQDPAWEALRRLSGGAPPRALVDGFTAAQEAGKQAPPDSKAAEEARSAAEAFLFQLLESLPETAGRFELNGRLVADWGPHGALEVDLLCRSRRVAVEIDGYHHFAGPDAYRRDRRKDALLQREGFLVLRFLAEDVVARLETILETIFNALTWRKDLDSERGV